MITEAAMRQAVGSGVSRGFERGRELDLGLSEFKKEVEKAVLDAVSGQFEMEEREKANGG